MCNYTKRGLKCCMGDFSFLRAGSSLFLRFLPPFEAAALLGVIKIARRGRGGIGVRRNVYVANTFHPNGRGVFLEVFLVDGGWRSPGFLPDEVTTSARVFKVLHMFCPFVWLLPRCLRPSCIFQHFNTPPQPPNHPNDNFEMRKMCENFSSLAS